MNPGSLLGGEAASRILALLASMPEQELHTNELIRRTGLSPNAIQRAAVQLERSGLLASRRVGNLRLWRMERANPLYPSVRDLAVRTRGVPARLADILRRDPGIALAFLFGSYASGTDDASSDIDLFVAGAPDWAGLARAVRRASSEVGRELRPVVWSLEDLRNPSDAQRSFLDNVLSGPLIWLRGDRDELDRHRRMASAVAARSAASHPERRRSKATRPGRRTER